MGSVLPLTNNVQTPPLLSYSPAPPLLHIPCVTSPSPVLISHSVAWLPLADSFSLFISPLLPHLHPPPPPSPPSLPHPLAVRDDGVVALKGLRRPSLVATASPTPVARTATQVTLHGHTLKESRSTQEERMRRWREREEKEEER